MVPRKMFEASGRARRQRARNVRHARKNGFATLRCLMYPAWIHNWPCLSKDSRHSCASYKFSFRNRNPVDAKSSCYHSIRHCNPSELHPCVLLSLEDFSYLLWEIDSAKADVNVWLRDEEIMSTRKLYWRCVKTSSSLCLYSPSFLCRTREAEPSPGDWIFISISCNLT